MPSLSDTMTGTVLRVVPISTALFAIVALAQRYLLAVLKSVPPGASPPPHAVANADWASRSRPSRALCRHSLVGARQERSRRPRCGLPPLSPIRCSWAMTTRCSCCPRWWRSPTALRTPTNAVCAYASTTSWCGRTGGCAVAGPPTAPLQLPAHPSTAMRDAPNWAVNGWLTLVPCGLNGPGG